MLLVGGELPLFFPGESQRQLLLAFGRFRVLPFDAVPLVFEDLLHLPRLLLSPGLKRPLRLAGEHLGPAIEVGTQLADVLGSVSLKASTNAIGDVPQAGLR